MESSHVTGAFQCQGVNGSPVGSKILQGLRQKQVSPDSIGQHCLSRLYKSSRWAVPSPVRDRSYDICRGGHVGRLSSGPALGGSSESRSRSAQSPVSQQHLQLVYSPRNIQFHRPHVGSTLLRSLRRHNEPCLPQIQLPLSRPSDSGSGRPGPAGLGTGEQLCQSSLLLNPQGPGCPPVAAGHSHTHSPLVARSNMVPQASKNGPVSPSPPSSIKPGVVPRQKARTPKESPLEDVCLADIWKESLVSKAGWSEHSAACTPYAWAKSTQQSYDRVINDFRLFCCQNSYTFPPDSSHCIAEYLCYVAKKSDRPKSVLNGTMAALSALYNILELKNPCNFHVRMLYTALIKTHTRQPRLRTKVMPVEPFHILFESWKDNNELPVKMLRLKCIVLLALAFMLRPSDIAPKAMAYDCDSDSFKLFVFSRSQVTFSDEGVRIMFFGIKNDSSRDGFEVCIPSCDNVKLDPVSALHVYMSKTKHLVSGDSHPVFIGLNRPYNAISAATVGSILAEAISLAGLDSSMFTPKCFRPSGATKAVECGFDPEKVRRLGRWKTSSVFFEHYVFDKTPDNFCNELFEV